MNKKFNKKVSKNIVTITKAEKRQSNEALLDKLFENKISWKKDGINLIHLIHEPTGETITINNNVSTQPAYRNYMIDKLLKKAKIF
jgi:hypothetical protein